MHIDYKSVASIRTLHNVKASSMLCLLVVWNLRNFKLMVKDIGGSDCYWYAHKNACRGVPWGYIVYSRHTIPEKRPHTSAGKNSTRSPSRAISQGLKHGRVRVEACAFLLCIYKNKQFLCPNRVSMDTLETIWKSHWIKFYH